MQNRYPGLYTLKHIMTLIPSLPSRTIMRWIEGGLVSETLPTKGTGYFRGFSLENLFEICFIAQLKELQLCNAQIKPFLWELRKIPDKKGRFIVGHKKAWHGLPYSEKFEIRSTANPQSTLSSTLGVITVIVSLDAIAEHISLHLANG